MLIRGFSSPDEERSVDPAGKKIFCCIARDRTVVPGRQHDEGDLGDDDDHDGDMDVAPVYDNDDDDGGGDHDGDDGDKAAAFDHYSDDEADSDNDDVGNEEI